jgi:murein DD-endopeptidase MepM/ murein hydrolase activator NlpD
MAELVATTNSGGSVTQQPLTGEFQLPLGAWFTLQVRQVLGAGSRAQSLVYVNNQLVGSSNAANFIGDHVDNISYGIVSLTGGAEQGPVSLYFDQAFAAGYTGYGSPLHGDRYQTGRTDQGVDFCLARGEPIRALGDGVVVGIDHNWFKGQPYVWYQLLDGPFAGHYVYVAEQITRLAQPGAALSAGQPVAYYKRSGTCIETGWSMPNGATQARVTTGYREGQVTVAGVSFARFLRSLGVGGPFELKPTHATRKPAKPVHARRSAHKA